MARVEGELRALGAPPPWRASFVSVMALAWPDGALETFEGRVDGTLVFPPRGTAGFGYDPIFRPDGHDAHLRRDERRGEARHSGRRLARPLASRPRVPEACARPALSSGKPSATKSKI